MPRDCDLLEDFVSHGSEDAFRALVERHTAMVHGVALRTLRDEALAQEVTQAVFIILGRKADALPRGTILAGWLYRTARFVALEAIRAQKRRQKHYEEFARMNATDSPDSLWNKVAPVLEEVVCRLSDADRNAIVLRFIEERSFADVASALGTTEAAAKMRVGRALEKLRAALTRRGVVVPAAALMATLSAHSAAALPPGFSTAVATVAHAKGTAASTALLDLVSAASKALAWYKMKSGLVVGAMVMFLVGSALLLQQKLGGQTGAHPQHVASLDPMAGEWEGTFEMTGAGMPNPVRQPVALSVRTTRAGRSCEIEMRVTNAAGKPTAVYRFTHTLNKTGDHIITADDPQIARMNGDGIITEGVEDRNSGVWRVTFRTPDVSGRRYSECRWIRSGNELSITRRDQISGGQGTNQLESVLKLHRPIAETNR